MAQTHAGRWKPRTWPPTILGFLSLPHRRPHGYGNGHVIQGRAAGEFTMTAIVKRSVFAVRQSPVADASELTGAIWKCPATHTHIATLRVAMSWTQRSNRDSGRTLGGSKATAVLWFAAVVTLLLATAGAFIGMIYLSGLLMQNMKQLQRYNESHAQYSDVWKWQRQK